MKINWGNRIENAVLVMIAVLMTFFVMKSIYQPQLDKQQETIVELASIARYAIQNDFKKVKAKDGTIVLDLENDMKVTDIDTATNDSIPEEPEKQGFFKRLFGGD